MKNVTNFQRGFTIVELLIVIVIIGVLAAITVTTFTGTQKRAQDTKTLALVNQWEKTMAAYAAIHGEYPNPNVGSNSHYCLGELPANSEFASGLCSKASAPTPHNSSYQASILSNADLPNPNSEIDIVRFNQSGSRDKRGIVLATNVSNKTNYRISYPLRQERCASGDSVGYQVTADNQAITAATPPGTYGRAKQCVRALPEL